MPTAPSPLASIITGVRALPPRVLVYGTDKVGKNTWAAGAPRPIVIQAEEGSDELGTPRFPLATTFPQLMSQLAALATEAHPYWTVILDSADWIERLIWAHVCATEDVKQIEKVGGGYGKGYIAALNFWREILDALKWLRNEKGMAVILICHHEVRSANLPDCDPFDQYRPKLNKYAMGMLKEWCDAILFAGYKMYTKSTVVAGDKVQHKGIGTGERVIYCTERPTHLAGNRYALPDTLPMPRVGGWQIFSDQVSAYFASQVHESVPSTTTPAPVTTAAT